MRWLIKVVYWRVDLSFVTGRRRALGRNDGCADENEKMKRKRTEKIVGEEAIIRDECEVLS